MSICWHQTKTPHKKYQKINEETPSPSTSMPPPPQTKKESHTTNPSCHNSSSVVMVPDFKMNWSTPTKATVLPHGTSWEVDFDDKNSRSWSETEKKKSFPWLTEKKGIPEIWRHPTWQVIFYVIFCSLFDDESKPIPTDSMMKYPTTTKKELLNLLGGTTHHQHGALDVLHVQVLLASWDWSRNTTPEVNQCSVGDWGLPSKETLP